MSGVGGNARRPAGSSALRIAVAAMLRRAHVDGRDAALLRRDGSARNAADLLRRAVSALVGAVDASEHGWPLDPHRREATIVPVEFARRTEYAALLRVMGRLPPPAVPSSGRRATEPDLVDLDEGVRALAFLLGELATAFAVDLDGDAPAGSVRPFRREPPVVATRATPVAAPARPDPTRSATRTDRRTAAGARRRRYRREAPVRDEAPVPVDPPRRVPIVVRRTRPAPGPTPDAARRTVPPAMSPAFSRGASPVTPPGVPPHPPDATSTVFWSLMDRWQVGDAEALTLVGHRGGLTRKGTRPRFRVTGREALVFATLREIDDALSSLAEKPAVWLRRPVRDDPFGGATPLEHVARRGLAGAGDVLRAVTMLSLQRSL